MADIMEVIRARHSVRQYLDRAIPEDLRQVLDAYAEELNGRSGLRIQMIFDEPDCFNALIARYGRFVGCFNYISVVGKKTPDLDEKAGYYGELLVLKAQELGLNTCWVAASHGKSAANVLDGEKEAIVISLGYGRTQGRPHRSKSAERVSELTEGDPDWYRRGIEAALLAPTAINQQNFRFSREGDLVTARAGRIGKCLRIDLGIAKCHFELAAGRENFRWA